MMAALFIFYVLSLLLIAGNQRNKAFSLVVVNLVLCLLLLVYHINIWL